MEANDNQRIMVNALVVAMETMLQEIESESADLTVLSSENLALVEQIKAGIKAGLKELNAFLEDGDMTHVGHAATAMVTAQAAIAAKMPWLNNPGQ